MTKEERILFHQNKHAETERKLKRHMILMAGKDAGIDAFEKFRELQRELKKHKAILDFYESL